jgi:plastocyanin
MQRRSHRRFALLGILSILIVLGVAVAAHGAETITAAPAPLTQFSQDEFHSNEGERPVFTGNGEDFHNVTAKGRGPDGRELFRTRSIKSGSAPVEGAQYLITGSYPFECTLHAGMEATLVVSSDGTPKARPRVIAAVLRQSLERVRKTGRLRVRLRTPTGARNVSVIARGAGAVLARADGLNLAKGSSRVVGLQLTRRGRAALANRRSARVSVAVKIPFGSPVSETKTLHGG